VVFRVSEDSPLHRKIGVVIPSTNWIVEAELQTLPDLDVSFHFGRMLIRDARMDTDEHFEALMVQIRETMLSTVESVVTCRPDYLMMAMSSETFWGGREGNERLTRQLEEASGLRVTTGAAACDDALKLVGAKRIAVVTPYQQIGDRQVHQFFTDLGYVVTTVHGLRCEDALAITRVTEETLRVALREIDGADVDALVQVGTNLSMIRLADEAERWLGKPVIAINAAVLWHTLRAVGIDTQFAGFGSLLEHH
jgi:maleate isomerase